MVAIDTRGVVGKRFAFYKFVATKEIAASFRGPGGYFLLSMYSTSFKTNAAKAIINTRASYTDNRPHLLSEDVG